MFINSRLSVIIYKNAIYPRIFITFFKMAFFQFFAIIQSEPEFRQSTWLQKLDPPLYSLVWLVKRL